ncbi:unnamed protein product [Owenia fusiformis]|uniref:Uncharacterized protein n=1 Tax=Owenia fusiformis TaxID=6347 RepID=A0A8J1UIW0_OWEFU|nr:unnamed protein product [Owenia fusiformis]
MAEASEGNISPPPALPIKTGKFITKGVASRVIVDDTGVLTYIPSLDHNPPVALLVGESSIKECPSTFFEIKILQTGKSQCCASIGLIPEGYSVGRQPGWKDPSIGFHADDGLVYRNGRGEGQQGKYRCKKGDVMGLKVTKAADNNFSVEFYKNYELAYKYKWQCKSRKILPAIGMHNAGEQVHLLNFLAHKDRKNPIPGDVNQFIIKGRSNLVEIQPDGILSYSATVPKSPVGTFIGKHSLNKEHSNFELKILEGGASRTISIGLVHSEYQFERHPGWDVGSVAYHADDGRIFRELLTGSGPPIPCQKGDVMGCGYVTTGVQYDSDGIPLCNQNIIVYFTKNACKVHECKFTYRGGGLHPTVGLHSRGEKVHLLNYYNHNEIKDDKDKAAEAVGGIPDSDSSIENPLVSCTVCLSLYNEEDHMPKLLPCHHSFCRSCLDTLLNNSIIVCPSCRKTHRIADGVDALQTNFYVTNMKELLRRDCSLEDIIEKEVKPKEVKGCTKHHNQPLSFFCVSCTAVICRDCTVLGHNMGQGHVVKEISEVKDENLMDLKNILSKTNVAFDLQSVLIERLELCIASLDTTRDSCHYQVDTKFDQCIQQMKNRKDSLKEEIDELYENKKSTVDNKIKFVKRNRDSMHKLRSKIQQAIEADNVEDIVTLASDHNILSNLDASLCSYHTENIQGLHILDTKAKELFEKSLMMFKCAIKQNTQN